MSESSAKAIRKSVTALQIYPIIMPAASKAAIFLTLLDMIMIKPVAMTAPTNADSTSIYPLT